MLLYLSLFFLAGFIQEILITTYHRAVATNRVAAATLLTITITILVLLVMAEITRKIFDPSFGIISYLFVVIFALGKGFGCYISLRKLSKLWPRDDKASS